MIEWGPVVNAVVANAAVPPVSGPLPSVVTPSLNVTVPVAVLGVTVAVKVTVCPERLGLGDAVTDADVVSRLIEIVALPDAPAPLLAVADAVLIMEPTGAPGATRVTSEKLLTPGETLAAEHVTAPPEPTEGVVQLHPPGGVRLTKVRPVGRVSVQDRLFAVPTVTVTETAYVTLVPAIADPGVAVMPTARIGVGATTVSV